MGTSKGIVIGAALMGIAATGWAQGTVEKASAAKQGIRIAVRNNPGVSEFEEDDRGLITKRDYDEQAGVQIDVMYARRHMGKDGSNTFGPMWGAGLFLASSSGDESGGTDEVDLTAFGVIGQGGLAVQLGEVVVLEFGGSLALGGAEQEVSGFTSGSGAYVSYSLKAGAYFQLGDNVELGLEAGYVGFESYAEFDYGTYTTDVTFSGDGFQGGGVFVVKF